MHNRRRLLQLVPASAALWPGGPRAEIVPAPGERIALVIGNARYRSANPLRSTSNDARAMAQLLQRAGFRVDVRIDATHRQIIDAGDALVRAASAPGVRVVLFYYAGHAAQLGWRNYLLPIDIEVSNAADVRARCVDVARLLAPLGKRTAGRATVVVLDACRDDPFGGTFRPEHRGLSPYDAPPGTLIAFATAPGRVAIEPPGRRHGLYTEHLLRELDVHGLRFEDALKRVRLAVRLASRGAQVPWESTSLESDLVLFAAPRLTSTALERRLADELALWRQVRGSRRVEDLADFIRRYPDGRLAEHAQVRLTRLLTGGEPERPADARVGSPVGIVLGAGLPVPAALQRPPSPHSAGTYPFRPVWTVGDEYVFRNFDRTGRVDRGLSRHVVRHVDLERERVELGDDVLLDLSGNVLRGGGREFDVPILLNPAELQVGRRWTVRFEQSGRSPGSGEYAFRVLRRERVQVPAGGFDAFRIEGTGWFVPRSTMRADRANQRLQSVRWVVPGLNLEVRRERLQFDDSRVLVSARQRE